MEQLLHYVWKHKMFPLHTLRTTQGAEIEVIDTGLVNTNAGPDFFNAKLKIDGTLWVGNVEIHTSSSDWFKHGHHTDAAYNNVILHVVAQADGETPRDNGEVIPQLVLPCPDHVKQHFTELKQATFTPACYAVVAALPQIIISSWLTALQTERFEQKSSLLKQRLEKCANNWEDAFFVTLARYAGVGINGDAFEHWANSIPWNFAAKIRDDVSRIEALFLGMAGFLKGDAVDEYMAKLQREFRYQTHLYGLPDTMEVSRWKFLRLRPDNFPYIRISQLAMLYHQSFGLFSKLMEADSIEAIRLLLTANVSSYWQSHYTFGQSSATKPKQWGKTLQDILIINCIVPFLYSYGLHRGEEHLCARAQKLLEELKAENNFITRLWHQTGITAHNAAESQALLQLYRSYCEPKKCLFCRFGYEYLRKETK